MSKKESRDASDPMNGYLYQRYYAIKLILENKNNEDIEYVVEEMHEDIDFLKYNEENESKNKIIAHQIKYYKNGDPETLTRGSGLYKVILGNWKKK